MKIVGVSLTQKPCPSSFFFVENGKENHQKIVFFFYPHRTPKNPGKKGNMLKKQGVPRRGNFPRQGMGGQAAPGPGAKNTVVTPLKF